MSFFSRKLRGAPLAYATHEREMLAIVLACKRWRPYLDGKVTRVVTDHRSLQHLPTQPLLSPRQVRWMEYLANFHLRIEYRPGKAAVVPDALSRLGSMVFEPGWAGRVAKGQFDPADTVMARLVALARGDDARFRVRGEGPVSLLYRTGTSSDSGDRLVLPEAGGFRQLAMREVHDATLGGHMGHRKTLAALQQRVWWPGMDDEVRAFVAGCPVC